MVTINAILEEMKEIPIERLDEVYQFVHSINIHYKNNDLQKEIKTVKQVEQDIMKNAVDQLLHDYKTDPDLTAFTSLDREDFYETR